MPHVLADDFGEAGIFRSYCDRLACGHLIHLCWTGKDGSEYCSRECLESDGPSFDLPLGITVKIGREVKIENGRVRLLPTPKVKTAQPSEVKTIVPSKVRMLPTLASASKVKTARPGEVKVKTIPEEVKVKILGNHPKPAIHNHLKTGQR